MLFQVGVLVLLHWSCFLIPKGFYMCCPVDGTGIGWDAPGSTALIEGFWQDED